MKLARALCALLLLAVPTAAQVTVLYQDTFEALAPGSDLPTWLDSELADPSQPADFLFGVHADPEDPSNVVFGHVRDDSTGFSHYTAAAFAPTEGFRLDGRMYRSHPGGHIGVTLFSELPALHDHYLIGQTSQDGTVEAHACGAVASGAGTPYPDCTLGPLQGSLDSGVHLTFATWYRFRLETLREVGGLRILFKIWADGDGEPATWQIDALDPASEFASGQLGLWGTNWGNQFWDDLHIQHAPVAPAIAISEAGSAFPTGGLYNRDVVPEIEVVDSSPTTVSVLLDGQPFTSGTPIPTEGEHQLEVQATDIYGNSSTASRTFEIDKTPPVFISVTPPDGTLTGDAQIGLQGVVEGAETLFIDGVPVPLQGTGFTVGTLGLPEGASILLLRAVDRAGNAAEVLHSLELDTTPPTVTIAQPGPGITGTAQVTVSGTAQDLHLAEVRVNGTVASLAGNQFTASAVALAEGDNTLLVEAVDAVGNTGSASRDLTLDTIPPLIEITDGGAPLAEGLLTNQTVVPVITASDATAVQLNVQLNGAGFVSGSPVATDGTYQVSAVATDAAGNVATASRGFEVDKTPPVFQSVSPPDGFLTGGGTVVLSGVVVGADAMTVAGQAGALVGEDFTSVSISLVEGTNTIELTATDAAGNSAAIDHQIELDSLPPEIQILEPVDLSILGSTPTRVSGAVRDAHLDGVTVNGIPAAVVGETFTVESFALAEGSNLVSAVATDILGHAASDDSAVTLDTIPPTIAILESGSPLVDGTLFNRAAQTVIQVEDATAVVVAPLLDGSAFPAGGGTVGTEGLHELQVTATDAAGNSSSALVNFTIDTLPPVFVEILPAEGSLTAAGEVTVTGVVLDAVGVTIDGAPVTLSGEDFVSGLLALVEGETEFALEAVDAAGNLAQTTHVLIRDSTPPVINIVDPGDGALLGTASAGVSGPVFDLHLDTVEVNGIEAEVSGETYLAIGVPLAEGGNQVIAVARDGAGNVGTAAIDVVLDTLPPDVLIVDPANATTTAAGRIVLTGTAVDPHLDRVEVNGAPAALVGNQWTVDLPLAEGANDFRAVGFDRLGHTGDDEVMVLRDATAPTITILSPGEGARFNVGVTDVTGTVEAEPGTLVTVNGISADLVGAAFTAVDVPLVEGENRLIARGRDPLGNEGVDSRLVFVDTVPPELIASDPVGGALAIGVESSFRLSFSEELGPVEVADVTLAVAGGATLHVPLDQAGDEIRVVPLALLPSGTDLDLSVTDGLEDLAGNPLANPQVLRFTTVDANAPDPPVIDVPPPFVCAGRLELTGTAEVGSTVIVSGGAATVEVDVADDGSFAVPVPLVPDRLNALSLAARDANGNQSTSVSVQVFHDCRGPVVISARREGDVFRAFFDEPVDSSSVVLAGSLTLMSEGGDVVGTVTAVGEAEATFTAASALPAGVYRFAVSQQVQDRAGNPLAYPFAKRFGGAVAAGTAFLTGTVIDDSRGRPLAGALVSVIASDGAVLAEPLPEQVTGEDGRFAIPIGAGTHEVSVTRTGYSPVIRVASTIADEGRDLIDPRLTPLGSAEEVDTGGETVTTDDGARLLIPAGAVAGAVEVTVTRLDEQGLPALLPLGWSPRGGIWVEVDDPAGLGPSTLTLPVEAGNGTVLPVAELDFVTLQWRVLELASVLDGQVQFAIPGEGAYAAVEADSGPMAPSAAVPGLVLGSAPAAGREVIAAQLDFSPQVVLPAQSSRATVTYTLGLDVPSGVPLTLNIREELSLLGGATRVEAPYTADLVLYRDPTGSPRSQFQLQPSEAARLLPLQIGHEDVTLTSYGGETVRGNVLGPAGGSVTSAEGDAVELPAGAIDEPTAIVLRRGDPAELEPPAPAGGTVLGVLELDTGGTALLAPVSLSLRQDPPPIPGAMALVFELTIHGGIPIYRPVAEAQATAEGWSSVPLNPADLAWPGIFGNGVFVFFQPAAPFGFFRGLVRDVGGAPAPGAVVSSAGLGWVQVASVDGSYVFPVPVVGPGESTVLQADFTATGNRGSAAGAVTAPAERVDLDISLLAVGPEVIAVTPADASTGVPAGVQPSVRFSEPVDPATAALGVRLLLDGSPVAVTHEVDGALVTIVPDATLLPGESYEIRVETTVRDLFGFPLESAVSAQFETLLVLFNEDIDLSKVFLIEPDPLGFAQVVGQAGAVPHGTLVFVENLDALVSTPSVEAAQDGSFNISIEADVSHRILMHVLVEGSNELVLELTPFRTTDLKGAYVTERGAEFTTGDDFIVYVEEGSFDQPTLVRVEAEPVEAAGVPVPPSFGSVLGFSLELDGGRALKGLRISVPAPPGITGGPFYVAAPVTTFHGQKWMIDDVAQLVNGRLTTEIAPDPAAGGAGPGAPATGAPQSSAPGVGSAAGVTGPTPSSPGPARQGATPPPAGPGVSVVVADPPTPVPVVVSDPPTPVPAESGPAPTVPRHLLPGMWSGKKRNYQFWDSSDQLGWVSLPVISGSIMFLPGMDLALSLSSLTTPLLRGSVAIPTRLEDPFDIEVRDLTTGYILFDETFGPPPNDGEVIELPVDPDADDTEPPAPVAAHPVQLYTLELGRRQSSVIGRGLAVDVTGSGSSTTLTITGAPDSAQGEVKVRLLNLVSGAAEFTTSAGDGSFTLTMSGEEGERVVLAIGAKVGSSQVFDLEFSEALDTDLSGIDVLGPNGRSVDPIVRAVGTTERVRITPRPAWVAGNTYTIVLEAELADASANEWGQRLEIEFEIERAKELSTYNTFDANGIVRVGRYLVATSIAEGIMVLDAGDPNGLKHAVAGGVSLPFRDGARGLAADPHGRVMVVAGGLFSPGQLAIFDPLDFDPADIAANAGQVITRYRSINGVTRISKSRFGAINLPEGTPQRVAILSNDERSEWRVGVDPAPAGVTVSGDPPPDGGDYTITVTGADGSDGLPVTLRDRDLGRWHRVDASGSNYSIQLEVRQGSRLELLRNRQTIAYVAVAKAGIAVVDVNGFYNSDDTTTSHVLAYFTQAADPEFVICRDAPRGLEIVTQIKVIDDPEASHPLAIPTVIFREGLLMMSAPPTQPASIQPIAKTCPVIGDFPGGVIGLEVLKNFPFDANGDGELSDAERTRDYLLLGHVSGVVMIYDVTARTSPQLVSQVDIGGTISHLAADRVQGRLYVSGFSGGVHVVGLGGKLSTGLLDGDGDGRDDRIVETVTIGGVTKSPILVVPELGIIYAGGRNRGVTGVAVDKPLVTALGKDATGGLRPIDRLAPFGVPTAPEPGSEDEEDPPMQPGSFFVLASLPGYSGDTVTIDIESRGPLGATLPEVGDPDAVADLPRRKFTGDHAVELTRISNKPTDEGYHLFLSEEIAVLADLRAARGYTRSDIENDHCERCDQEEEGTGTEALQLISGDIIKMRFSEELRSAMEPIYGRDRLRSAEFELESVPWDLSLAARQEPTLNPSYGAGEVPPGTLLHSGEFSRAVTDLSIRGRGFDFAFTRTYRSQTVSDGPLGPGWDHSYRQRLRELPNGNVQYFDGRGRMEVFEKTEDEATGETSFEAPLGRFAELRRTADGWLLLDARRNIASFDRFGRLVSLADYVKESEDTGNLMTFHYNAASLLERVTDTLDRDIYFEYDEGGHLEKITDFDDREVLYEYDSDGRLDKVSSPNISTGFGPFGRLVTRSEYETPPAGSLTEYLNSRDNVTEFRDARGQRWLTVGYTDADGDGIGNEATTQSWGERSLSISYNFTSHQASVTDRRGNSWSTQHRPEGQATSRTDPSGAVFRYTHTDEGLIESETLPLGRRTEYTYDQTSGTRSRGNAKTITVTADGRGENGSSLSLITTIDYDLATNQPTSVTDPRGATTTISRSPNGLARVVARPEGAVTSTEYNDFGQPTMITNPNSNKTEYTYFESGESEGYLRRTVVDPENLALTTRFETDARGNVTASIDPRGVRHETAFNEVDWRASSTAASTGAADGSGAGPLSYRTEYVYDENGNVTTERLPFGATGAGFTANRTTYGVLNEVRQVTREIGAGGGSVTELRTYDPNFNLDTVTHPEGNLTKYDYDSRNLLEKTTLGFGSTAFQPENYAYNADGERTSRTNGRLQTWTTQYDGFGRAMRVDDPLGNHTTTSYDNSSNPVMSMSYDSGSGLLAQSGAEFDLLNRRTASTQTLFGAGDPSTDGTLRSTTTYDPASNIRATTDTLGRTTQFVYDAAERQFETIDPAGNRTVSTLDANGNATHTDLVEVVSGGSPVTVPMGSTFDALNRRLTSTDALGNVTRTAYDARSNVIRRVDAEGFLTSSNFDGLNREIKTTRPSGIGVEYGYDGNSRLTSYKDALGNETRFTYDAVDRKKSTTYPDSTVEAFTYDSAGNVTGMTDANGSAVTQTWDAANRLVARSVAPGTGVEGVINEIYAYDGLDRVTQAVSGGTVTLFTYDSASRMTSEATSVNGGASKAVSYGHDAAGNATRITYPSGHEVTANYDPLDRPGIVSGGGASAVSYGYRGADLVQATQYGNGIQGEMTFDAVKRPISNSYQRGGGSDSPAFSEQIAWSPRNLKVETTRADLGGRGLVVGYDPAGRVTAAARVDAPSTGNNSSPSVNPADGFTYAYDRAENLLERSEISEAGTRNVELPLDGSGRNRPGAIASLPLAYDPNGNLTQRGDLNFHYDYRNRISRVTDAAGAEVASYTYDALNRRVARTVGGEVEETVWGGWQNLEQYAPDGSGGQQLASRRTFGAGLDEIVRLESDVDGDGVLETTVTPLYDSTGNLVLATGPDGRTLERYEYSPFGGRTIVADFSGPQAEQIRTVGGQLWIELTDRPLPASLQASVDDGSFALIVDGVAAPITVTQPVTSGRQAGRRLVIDAGAVPAGSAVSLVLPAAGLIDDSGNPAPGDISHDFTWPSGDALILDATPPLLAYVSLDGSQLEIQFSEEADLASASSTITLDGAGTSWALQPDRYTLTGTATLSAGAHTLAISTGPLDLDGKGLAAAFTLDFGVTSDPGPCPPGTICAHSSNGGILHEGPGANEVFISTVANRYGFHGRPVDPETGLVYIRNRYYDAEMGRFVSDDPHFYSDGPNTRQFALNSPFVLGDPQGTTVYGYATARLTRGQGYAGHAQFDPIDPTVLSNRGRDADNVQSGSEFAATIARASAGGRLVTFVHGYNVEVGGFRNGLQNFDAGFNAAGRPQSIYGFTWKGDPFGRPASTPFFGLAEENADLSGYAFGRYLMRSRRAAGQGTDLFAVTHSLGARVALRGLQFLSTLRRSIYNDGAQHNLDGLFMLNAAVTARSVKSGGFLESAFSTVSNVGNFFSENDPVLQGVFKKRKFGRALGATKMRAMISPLARNYSDFDMMDGSVAGSPVCSHSNHLKPSEWPYTLSGMVTRDPRCYGAGFAHGKLFRTLDQAMNNASKN